MKEAIRVGSVDIAVARDSYWAAAPATHLRDRASNEIPLECFTPYVGRQDPTTQVASRVLCFVVKSQGKTILLDAGVGAWGLWRFGDGHLLDALAGLDVRPEEIDVVIPSHLHLDHIGWNTRPGPDGQPVITFPNARYMFHTGDWDRFTDPVTINRQDPDSRLARIADTCLLPISDAKQMDLVTTDASVTREVKILHTPGHTPGSVSVLVESGGESVLFIGDVAHLCVQLTEYDWSPLGDVDRELSPLSRQRVVEEAVGRNALVAGPHLEEGPVFGHMVMLNGRRVWQGVDVPAQRASVPHERIKRREQMHPQPTTRREALRWLALTAVGSLLAACAQPAPSPPQAPPTAPPAAAATQPVAAAATSAPAPAATTNANAAGTPKSGGTLQVGMIGDLGTIDGHQVTQATVNVSFLGYDRLIDYDDKLTPIPMLAESWDVSNDLTQFKLNLRKGVQFHSGREFTSDDVKYNMLRVRDPKVTGIVGALAAESAWFTNIDTPDKYTIVLTSDKSRPGAFDFFEYFNMLDKDTMEGPDAKTKIVGTGPFAFVEWVQGDHFTFTRNKNYWQSDRPFFDGASIKVFTDAQAQIAQLEAGVLDLADSPPIRDADRLRNDPAYNYLGTFIGGQYFCVFINTSVPPLDNKVVRQTLNWALDRQRFATTVMLNLVGPGQDLPWPPQAGASEPAKNNVYAFDLDKAKSLLSSAGVGPFEIDILYHNLAYPTEIAALAQLYQADLAKIGITANLKLLEFATFADTVLNQPYHGLAIAGGAFAHLAESTTAFSTGRGSNIMLKQNWSHYQNDDLANLVQSASVEPDAAKRKQLYSQINDAFLDQVFNMPVSLYPAMSLTHNNIHGVRYNLLPGLVYTDAWKG